MISIYHVCHGWSVSIKKELPRFPIQVYGWISKYSLAALLSLTVSSTHTHNPYSEMSHTFTLYTGACSLPSLPGFWERMSTFFLPALKDFAQPAHVLHRVSFPSSLSACLPPLLFVTIQPTYFSHISRALLETLHNPLSTISTPVVHMFVILVRKEKCCSFAFSWILTAYVKWLTLVSLIAKFKL